MRNLSVTREEEGQRLLRYLSRVMPQAPASFFHKMLRKKNITLNGKRADGSEALRTGDEVKLFLAEETIDKFAGTPPRPEAVRASGPLTVLYEDADILIADKPAGLLTQKAAAGDDSLNDRLLSYLKASGAWRGDGTDRFTPSAANRLDRNTSGLVACGKTVRGLQYLSEVFRERTGEKTYVALARGRGIPEGVQTGWLTKEEASNTVTLTANERPGAHEVRTGIRVLAEAKDVSLLELELITGRTHQLRAQLSAMGHPLLGDAKYGGAAPGVRRQMLHAWRLSLPAQGPDGKAVTVSSPLPAEVRTIMEKQGEWTWRPGTAEACAALISKK